MNRKLSLFISVLFHPVFVNLVSLLLLFTLFPFLHFAFSKGLKTFYILFIFITTGLIPVAIVGLLKLTEKVSSFLMDIREERTIPYIVTACIYLFDYYFCIYLHGPQLLTAYLLGSSCIVAAILIINLFDKISIHAASLGALAALVISAMPVMSFEGRILLSIVLVFTGLTATARLFLNAHVPHQVYSGFFLGLVIMLFIL